MNVIWARKLNPRSDPYYDAYVSLLELCERLNIIHQKKPPSLAGLVGELLVKFKLSEEGILFESHGGQGCYDILASGGLRLEVRASRPKGSLMRHGWSVEKRDKGMQFDYLLCVALDDNLGAPRFFVFTRDELINGLEERQVDWYSRVIKRIELFADYPTYAKSRGDISNSSLETDFNMNPEKYENKWSILKGKGIDSPQKV